MSEILFGPVPHKEAVDFIAKKPVVSREVFDQLVPEVRARTFLVSGMVPLDLAQKLRDRIAALPAGADWDQVKGDLADSLSPFFLKKNEESGVTEPDVEAAQRRAELLIRTHGYQAYSAAQYNVLQRQKDVFRFWRYQTAQDDRVREAHAALEGKVLPADDPFWQTHFPPWDFNCRCTVVPLSDADMEEIQVEDKSLPPDQRSVLTEEQRARMNDSGFLITGPNQNVDVRSPRQKRDGDGYAWQPGDLTLPLATIKERYSPDVFSAFEKFAGHQQLDDGRTLLEWIGGEPREKSFTAAKAAAAWAAEKMGAQFAALPAAQRAAVAGYQGEDFTAINRTLRAGATGNPEMAAQVASIDAALAASPAPRALTVWRGVDTGLAEKLAVGAIHQEPGFTSTSLAPRPAREFALDALFQIAVPRGAPALYLSGREVEILLSRGSRFRILAKERRAGRWHIAAELLSPTT
ncbi:MAG: minor capsid protein [Verrucomicrobia bacterium]|nr:minor capsid protein [Verrucomicrobiota bacterium]